MIKLVIFDMDGLMFDTETVTCQAFLQVLTESGYHPEREQYVQMLGLNKPAILKKYQEFFGENMDADAMYNQVGERREQILEENGFPVKKGLKTLLEEIDQRQLNKAVASGSDQQTIEHNLMVTGYAGRFDQILSTRNVKRGKPFPDIFLTICQNFGVDPKEALVLEDSANGVEAAVAAGIPVIQIPDMIRLPEQLEGKCLAVLNSLDEVIPFLDDGEKAENMDSDSRI